MQGSQHTSTSGSGGICTLTRLALAKTEWRRGPEMVLKSGPGAQAEVRVQSSLEAWVGVADDDDDDHFLSGLSGCLDR